ncbi:hypothetical protein BHM03_00008921 [Ensete ventricosum]|uniref:Glycosyltransferase subfamily 4-like N-terminal domain-containing protein n=1 Tax=Ensete ventricosum TaxID=4639 RepID=A0A445MCK6_ENSVE|nr:hypothetical protein BHM03_00008921 [Ensete ventricosum]
MTQLCGVQVIVVTNHEGVPQEFHGAKVIGSWSSLCSFPCPWYRKVPLSLALSPRIISEVANFKPDIIHASSPGIMVIATLKSIFSCMISYSSFSIAGIWCSDNCQDALCSYSDVISHPCSKVS